MSGPLIAPPRYTRAELLGCVDRELARRERVFPKIVADGRMTGAHATLEISQLRAVREVVAALPDGTPAQAALPFPKASGA